MKELSTCRVLDYLHFKKIVIHPKNEELRTITSENFNKIKESLKSSGFYEPIHIWTDKNWVLSGNHRLSAAIELIHGGYVFTSKAGDNYLPVVKHECDERTALGIMLQTNVHYAQYLENGLNEAIRAFNDKGGDPNILGFSDMEIASALSNAVADAEEIIEKIEKEVNLEDIDNSEEIKEILYEEEEEYASLVLPKECRKQLVELLTEISKKINSSWVEGDLYDKAIQALVQGWKENNMTDKL